MVPNIKAEVPAGDAEVFQGRAQKKNSKNFEKILRNSKKKTNMVLSFCLLIFFWLTN